MDRRKNPKLQISMDAANAPEPQATQSSQGVQSPLFLQSPPLQSAQGSRGPMSSKSPLSETFSDKEIEALLVVVKFKCGHQKHLTPEKLVEELKKLGITRNIEPTGNQEVFVEGPCGLDPELCRRVMEKIDEIRSMAAGTPKKKELEEAVKKDLDVSSLEDLGQRVHEYVEGMSESID